MKVFLAAIVYCWLPWESLCFVLGDQNNCLVSICNCTQRNVVDCRDKGLNSLPTIHVQSHTSYYSLTLQLSSNNLSGIPDHAFHSNFHHVSHLQLNLSDNRISFISSHAFDGFGDKITSMDLSNNALQAIPDVITNLRHLRSLFITNNPLISFDPDGMPSLSKHLVLFSFGHPNITQWPNELHNLYHLSTLRVSGARISSVPSGVFRYSGITHLTLNDTDLYEIPAAICDLHRLQRFEFSFNRNHASASGLFKPCQHELGAVTELILDNDDFYQVPTDIFGTFPNLKVLRIRGSPLLSDLDDLVVNSNNHLEILNLKRDNFAAIPEVVSRMPAITTLDISDNPVICNCFMGWIKNWSRRDNVTIVGTCQGGEQIRHYIDNSLLNFC